MPLIPIILFEIIISRFVVLSPQSCLVVNLLHLRYDRGTQFFAILADLLSFFNREN